MMKFTHKSLSLSLIIILLCFTLSSAHKKNKTRNHRDHSDHNDHSDHSDHSSSNANFHSDYKGCFSKVYAFGDSDTDTGNANFLGGGPPESNNISTHNSSYSIQHSMSGQLVVDYLCEALSIPPLSPYKGNSGNFKSGVNFAIAGSTAVSKDFFSRINISCPFWKKALTSFQTQVDWFEKYMSQMGCNKGEKNGACQADMDNSLFWLGEMGVSDYVTALGSPVSLLSLTELSANNECNLLQTLLSNGAKYVVVQGLPPVGCLPVCMASSSSHDRDHMGCVASVNKGIMLHNQILQTKLEKFRRQYPNCSILYADYWNAYLTVSMNPKKYGIEEPFKACCGCGGGQFNFDKNSLCGSQNTSTCQDPQKYINWDGVHLTGAMYKHISDLFLHQGFCQPSFDELVKNKKSM